jgi:hypothetical protein
MKLIILYFSVTFYSRPRRSKYTPPDWMWIFLAWRCDSVLFGIGMPTFRRNLLLSVPEVGRSKFHRNVGNVLPDSAATRCSISEDGNSRFLRNSNVLSYYIVSQLTRCHFEHNKTKFRTHIKDKTKWCWPCEGKKDKAIPVTDRGGPQVCETSRLDSRLTDGGEVVSLKRRPPFTPRKIPGTDFY